MAISTNQWKKANESQRAALRETAQQARLLKMQSRIDWYGRQVGQTLDLTVGARVRLAAQLLRDQIVINLSKPVRKYRKKLTRGDDKGKIRVVTDPASRSKPGEFPRADTTLLMKDIFYRMESPMSAIVGTSKFYGLILETKRNRSFLVRTFNATLPTIRNVLLGGNR